VPRPARVLAVSGALVAAGVVVGGTAHAAVSDAQPVEEAVELRVQPPEHGSGIQLICMADGTVTTTPPRPTEPPPRTRPPRPDPTTEPTTEKPTEEPVPGGGVVPLGQS
jgi:outer membrane biosynthesis protein TonB